MKTFNMSVNCMPVNIIGFGGENDVTEVICDFSAWAEEFGQGAISLAVRRPADIDPYLAVLTVDGTAAHWMITDVETSYKGHGEAQWIYTVGEQVKKSAVFGFCVERSLNSATVELPEAYQTWFNDLVALGADIHEVAENVYAATGHYPKIENGYWYVWDVENETWVSTGQKAQGEKGDKGDKGDTGATGATGVGIASTVLNYDYTLTITLTDGTSYTTAPIRGEKGEKGDKGDTGATGATGNGIASTVLNSNYTLTITFTDGTSYTTPSIRGAQGVEGQTGATGVTPQFSVGTITTGQPGSDASVSITGTAENPVLNMSIPRGNPGEVTQAELDALETELKEDLTNKADIIVSSASGAIASFSDGANYPVKSVTFEMNPVQSGSGDPSPTNIRPISGHTDVNVTRTGVNLANKTIFDITQPDFYTGQYWLGLTESNGVFTETRPLGWGGYGYVYVGTFKPCDFTISVAITSVASVTCAFQYLANKPNTWTEITHGNNASITSVGRYALSASISEPFDLWVIAAPYTSNGAEVKFTDIQLELGSTASTYEPYQGQSVTYTLGQTVYAGTLTVNEDGSGTIVSTDGYIASYNGETLPSTWISDRDVYTVGTVPTTGAEVVYKLATPVTIQLTEQEVLETLYGNNNIWHDANGDTEVTYRADTKAYVDGLVTEENTSIIAPIETGTTASQAYAVGKYFLLDGKFCKAKTAIASGATFTLNTNYTVTTIADELYTALH